MKIVLTIVGLLVLAMGLIWAGQGLGIVTWHPAGSPQSFMVDNKEWIYIGGGTALFGLIIIGLANKFGSSTSKSSYVRTTKNYIP